MMTAIPDKANATILDRLRYTADMVTFSPAWDQHLLADTIREIGQLMEQVADMEAATSCTCEHHDDGSCVAAGDLLNTGITIDRQQAEIAALRETLNPCDPPVRATPKPLVGDGGW